MQQPDRGQFVRRDRPLPVNPRRVRQGVKLLKSPPSGPTAWAGDRWRRLIDTLTERHGRAGEAAEALEYATLGQTKRLSVEDGVVRAQVQGRQPRPYQVTIELRRFDQGQREGLVRAMADQAVFAAKMLAGELPLDIDTLLEPLGTRLIPVDASELVGSCTCKDTGEWCKHLLCVMHLVADHLAQDPFAAFRLRGFEPDDLLERLRQSRAIASAGGLSMPVYTPAPPAGDGASLAALETLASRFWEGGDPGVPLVIEPPPVSHPLLRRLGPSPFEGRRFPMVGLLATCYEVISRHAIEGDLDPSEAAALGSEADALASDEPGAAPLSDAPVAAMPVSAVPPALQPKRIRGEKAKARPGASRPPAGA